MTRRHFARTGLAMAGAGVLTPSLLHDLHARHRAFNYKIGFQTWVVREELAKDFPALLSRMAGMGYETLELCSPPGYTGTGFETIAHLSARELKAVINDAGLTCHSSHYNFKELKEHTQERIDFAKELGLEHMVASSFGIRDGATMDDWKKAADEMNEVGAMGAKSGIQMGFHNHNGEFARIDGELIYDVLMDRLDPDLVKLQFQVWVVSIGFKAADYFRKHPGRFISAHLSDWSGKEEERTPIGHGVIDWADFFAAAEAGGLKHMYVEMAPPLLPESAAYLRGLR